MRTRIIQWLFTTPRQNGLRGEVRYGIQIYHKRMWMHAHRNGKPCIYKTREKAELERKAIRTRKEPSK